MREYVDPTSQASCGRYGVEPVGPQRPALQPRAGAHASVKNPRGESARRGRGLQIGPFGAHVCYVSTRKRRLRRVLRSRWHFFVAIFFFFRLQNFLTLSHLETPFFSNVLEVGTGRDFGALNGYFGILKGYWVL